LGGGAIAGFSAAFVIKRLGKYLLVVVGVYFASLLYLHHEGWITINATFSEMVNYVSDLVTAQLSLGRALLAVSLPILGAFLAGAYIGATR